MTTSLVIDENRTTTPVPPEPGASAHHGPRALRVLEWVALWLLTVLALGAVLLLMSPSSATATDPRAAMAQRRAEAVNVPPTGRERLLIAQRLAAGAR